MLEVCDARGLHVVQVRFEKGTGTKMFIGWPRGPRGSAGSMVNSSRIAKNVGYR